MTPLISEMVGEAMKSDPTFPEHFKWFDISDVPIETDGIYFTQRTYSSFIDTPLPFDHVAIVLIDNNGSKATVVLSQKHDAKMEGIVGRTWVKHINGAHFRTPLFIFRVVDTENDDEQTVEVLGLNEKGEVLTDVSEKEKQCFNTSLGYMCTFLNLLSYKPMTGYEATKRSNHAKRIRQGKVPLFDWRTITIEPTKPKGEYQGGTHASPRQHERRGHWRLIKRSMKRVWVKNCTVGNAARGVIFHDYKMKAGY
jgi:hypothetical protein